MRGDYSGKADDVHAKRIMTMQKDMIKLLIKRRTYKECSKSRNLSDQERYDSKCHVEKIESDIDRLREKMRQQ